MTRIRCAGWVFAAHTLCGLLLLTAAYIRPDSAATYSYLRSMVFDGDLSFFNEWSIFSLIQNGVTFFSEVTPTGALANHWWIGTSMLSAPFYLLGLRFDAGSGFGSLFAWTSVLFSATALSIACMFICGADALDAAHTGKSVCAIALIATSLGTPLFWYTFRFALGTHAAGALCVALIFAALFTEERRSWLSGAATGLAAGFAVATRLQHFVLIPAIVVIAIVQRRRISWWISATCAGALALAPQAIAWNAIYGTPLGPLTRGANLQGVTWMPFQHIALFAVLFSSFHGLIAWSPVVIVSMIGWVVGWRRHRDLALACVLMFIGEWLANGTLDRYFWGGMSFGGRRFVDLALPFALGIAWFAQRFGTRIAVAVITPLVAWSVALMIAAHANAISLARYVSGADLVAAVFNGGTWRRAVVTPLYVNTNWRVLIVVVAVAVLLFTVRRYAVNIAIVYTTLFAIAVAICAARTPAKAAESRIALGIDVRRASRVGPLLDESRLLADEVDWARAHGDVERVRETTNEIRAIDRLLSELNR